MVLLEMESDTQGIQLTDWYVSTTMFVCCVNVFTQVEV